MYSKDIEKNKKQRLSILQGAQNDVEMQIALHKKCKDNVLFFFNVFLWTYDPRQPKPNMPFVTRDYQDDFIMSCIQDISNDKDIFVEKSRDMGFTRMFLGVILRGALFRGRSCLVGSYKENYVDEQGNLDSMFERIRYMIERLPNRISGDLFSKYMLIKIGKGEIAGDSGQNFGTGGRRKLVYMDEFSYRQHDRQAMRKTRDVTNCRVIGGTPSGMFNVYGQIANQKGDYQSILFSRYRLHRKQHPFKTDERYEKQKQTRTPHEIATELDMSYDDSVEGQIYKGFHDIVTIGSFLYSSQRRTYLSFDFGRDSNAMIVWQKDLRTNFLYIVHTVKRVDRHIEKFIAFVTGNPTQGHIYNEKDHEEIQKANERNKTISGMWGDYYNSKSKQTNAEKSIEDIFKKYGYYLQCDNVNNTTVEDRINKVKLSLKRIHIDENQMDLIQSMIQSRYPKVRDGTEITTEKTKPVHDENSHYRTAFEYFIDNEPQSYIKNKVITADYSRVLS